jgi:hypothetical protein
VKHTTRGDNGTSFILIASQAISGTTPIVAQFPMQQYDGVALVLVTTGTVHGAWTIGAANNGLGNSTLNNPGGTGTYGDVTSLCAPAIAAVTAAGAQAVQIVPFGWGGGQLTFTPSSGSGNVAAYIFAKGNS